MSSGYAIISISAIDMASINMKKPITNNNAETSSSSLITRKTALIQRVSITAPHESQANTHSSLLVETVQVRGSDGTGLDSNT
jgi:hypothetical protein